MSPSNSQERDLREYSRITFRRLALGGVLLITVVGAGLIDLWQGPKAVLGAALCFGAMTVPIALVFIAFRLIDWAARRGRGE